MIKSKTIMFHGYKDDIINAKLEAIGLLNEIVYRKSSNKCLEFPVTWNLTEKNQTSFELVRLDTKSAEFLEVYADFMAKSKNKGFKCINVFKK